jgi:hypothetical protein
MVAGNANDWFTGGLNGLTATASTEFAQTQPSSAATPTDTATPTDLVTLSITISGTPSEAATLATAQRDLNIPIGALEIAGSWLRLGANNQDISVTLDINPAATVILTPPAVNITNANNSATTTVSGTATGDIATTTNLPAILSPTVGVDEMTGVITVTATNTNLTANHGGAYTVTVTREGVSATLTVNVNLTAPTQAEVLLATETTLTGWIIDGDRTEDVDAIEMVNAFINESGTLYVEFRINDDRGYVANMTAVHFNMELVFNNDIEAAAAETVLEDNGFTILNSTITNGVLGATVRAFIYQVPNGTYTATVNLSGLDRNSVNQAGDNAITELFVSADDNGNVATPTALRAGNNGAAIITGSDGYAILTVEPLIGDSVVGLPGGFEIRWSSDDEDIVTVSEPTVVPATIVAGLSAIANAVGYGDAVITAILYYNGAPYVGNVFTTFAVTVEEDGDNGGATPTSLEWDITETPMREGEMRTFTVITDVPATSDNTIVWSVTNGTVVVVANSYGLSANVTAGTAGIMTVTATFMDDTIRFPVEVLTDAEYDERRELDRTELYRLIASATELLDTTGISVNGADVSPDEFWVLGAVWTGFQGSRNVGQGVYNDIATTIQGLRIAIDALYEAIRTFEGARQPGTQQPGVVIPTIGLNPALVNINNNNLTATSAVTTTGAGTTAITASTLPAGVTAELNDGVITVTGVRGTAPISGTFTVTVTHGTASADLIVIVGLTAIGVDDPAEVNVSPDTMNITRDAMSQTAEIGSNTDITGLTVQHTIDGTVPAGVTVTVDGDEVTVEATGTAAISGNFTVTFIHGDVTATLTVNVNVAADDGGDNCCGDKWFIQGHGYFCTLGVLWGDATGDGIINVFDALRVAQFVAGIPNTDISLPAADATGDGVINVFDALRIAQYVAGIPNTVLGPTQP